MCGRYALALQPSAIVQMLRDSGMPIEAAPEDDGPDGPDRSHNFAPGSRGIVCRAYVDNQTGTQSSTLKYAPGVNRKELRSGGDSSTSYQLQCMKWGLHPTWTKRSSTSESTTTIINCRDDSLSTKGGMWEGMKKTKRCAILAEGFFEWLKMGSGEKIPHYIKRKDGYLMCFAGLWDNFRPGSSGDGMSAYSIITTSANEQMKTIHTRMPVIFDLGSNGLRIWLDHGETEWSSTLQSFLKPFAGELEIYPVDRKVGSTRNNSPSLVLPLKMNKTMLSITDFFTINNSDAKKKIEKSHMCTTNPNGKKDNSILEREVSRRQKQQGDLMALKAKNTGGKGQRDYKITKYYSANHCQG